MSPAPNRIDTYLNRLRLWQKFAVLALFGVVLVAAPSILYLHESGKVIDATRLETQGLRPLHDTLTLLQLSQQHRGLSALALNGDASARAARQSKQREVDQALDTLNQSLRQVKHNPMLDAVWQVVRNNWQYLKGGIDQGQISSAESYAAHTQLNADLLQLKSLLMQDYGLSFDPDAQGYYLITAALDEAPRLTELFGQTRGFGVGLLAQHQASPEQRIELRVLMDRAQEHYQALSNALANAGRLNPSLGDTLKPSSQAALDSARQAIALAQAQIIRASTLQFSANDYMRQFTSAIDAQFQLSEAVLVQLQALLTSRADALVAGRYLLGGLIVLLSLIAAYVNWRITRALLRQLGGEPAYAASILNRISEGDLAVPITLQTGDQSSLLFAMQDMRDHLAAIVGNVRHGADSIASASAQISAGNLDLSSRTEQQASSLTETAATTEQITSTVRQNAENAQQANTLAAAAAQSATEGGAIVHQLVATMRDINSRSAQVTEIISVIDSIAFQTNILALNAAVEAARAGEQGRGFAVVAAEVRGLAQRSAAAAKEIKGLIDTSVQATALGNQQAAQAGSTMEQIVTDVQRVTHIMGDISAASREQTTGIEEINVAVTQMDDVTRQNASLVEESVAAAASLKDQAEHLARLMAFFHLGGLDEPHAADGAVRAPATRATTRLALSAEAV
ncbi:methyl-accepting chemotaxis protein [Castellaniella caeni]